MSKKVREIPGYYYDDIKKKYFKITKDFKPPRKIDIVKNEGLEKKCKCPSLTKLLQERHIFNDDRLAYIKRSTGKLFMDRISSNWRNAKEIQTFQDLQDKIQIAKVHSNGRKLAIVAGRSGLLSNRLYIYHVKSKHRNKITLTKWYDNENHSSHSKITSFCWAGDVMSERFVYSSISERLLRPGFITRSSQFTYYDVNNDSQGTMFDFKQINDVTANVKSTASNLIAVGEEKGRVCLYELLKLQRKWHLDYSPKVLLFSNTLPYLYIGCQVGRIYQIDYRSKTDVTIIYPKQPSYCIDCIKSLKDENYIITSNWNGQISLTDLRMRKTVLEYRGHVNNHVKLRFLLNSQEDFLFAVGSDCYLRMWDVRSGQLQHQRNVSDSEYPLSIPCLSYSNCWAGDETLSGILCCNQNKYLFWPFQ